MKELDEARFIRHQMYGEKQSNWRQYAQMVLGPDASRMELLDYEFRNFFFKSIDGALGLVLRRRAFKKLFKSIGRNVIIGRNVTIRNGKNITLGDNVVIDEGSIIDGRGAESAGVIIGDNTIIGRNVLIHSKIGDLTISENCNIGSDSVIVSQGGLEIGKGVQIAGGCKISGGRFKLGEDGENNPVLKRYSAGTLRIGDNCFIGSGAIVSDGSR